MPNDIEKKVPNLDSSKEGTFKSTTPKSLKEAVDICTPLLCDI